MLGRWLVIQLVSWMLSNSKLIIHILHVLKWTYWSGLHCSFYESLIPFTTARSLASPVNRHTLYRLGQLVSYSIHPSAVAGRASIPIFKKGEKDDHSSGISLLSAVLKLLTKIIWLETEKAGICKEQQGFWRNMSMADAKLSIRQTVGKAKRI